MWDVTVRRSSRSVSWAWRNRLCIRRFCAVVAGSSGVRSMSVWGSGAGSRCWSGALMRGPAWSMMSTISVVLSSRSSVMVVSMFGVGWVMLPVSGWPPLPLVGVVVCGLSLRSSVMSSSGSAAVAGLGWGRAALGVVVGGLGWAG